MFFWLNSEGRDITLRKYLRILHLYGKNAIIIETYSTGTGHVSTGIEMRWKLTKITAPEHLRTDKDEMMELIKEAFDAIGFDGKRDVVTKVIFDFIAEPRFIPEPRETK